MGHILRVTRFGANFNYRRVFGIRWPFYSVRVPYPLKDTRPHPKYSGLRAWRLSLFPKDV